MKERQLYLSQRCVSGFDPNDMRNERKKQKTNNIIKNVKVFFTSKKIQQNKKIAYKMGNDAYISKL